MNAWVIFRRARIVLFTLLVLLCFTWAALFAVFLSHEWSHFSEFQKIVVLCLSLLYGFTGILLYLMAVVQFCFWWDVVRVVSLLIIHTGGSLVFMHYRNSFPCRGFGTETVCRQFTFAIFIGCWVFTVTMLFFAVILGIMAFLPRPVEPNGEDFPPSPASFKAGSLYDGRPPSFHSFDPRMGYDDKSTFPDEPLSPARALALANSAPQEPPRLWQGSQTRNSTDDPIYAQTMIARTDSPMNPPGADVKKADSFYFNPFSSPSPPPLPVYTPASETGNEPPSVPLTIPGRLPTVPELMYGARGMTSDSLPHDRAAPYTDPSASLPATFRGSHQPHHLYPEPVQTAMPRISSFHSSTASIHSKWAMSPSHALPPPDFTSGASGLQDLPTLYHAQNTTLKRNASVPNATAPNHSGSLARRSYILPVSESSLQRRGSDGQVVDHAQWQRLVLGAAAMT
ncbi:hypothetical protein EDB87DRAFT_179088 [Lactarius vividus]|nr:hypothetical protein EDB87DRAFT_179088 [Lactarius vividus]